jgi:NADH dehydrogenase [ubiquinone] 1 alpha subcomplex assembly factor 7
VTALERWLIRDIRSYGPMDIGQFMGYALGHPDYGYYMTRDPLGVAGDFTTAPEISQMFGEMIGLWAADCWIQAGRPDPFILLECGPGRGTLMADALRAASKVEGFAAAKRLILQEISPVLRQKQQAALENHAPAWISDLSELSKEYPIIMIGNEFIDALPIRQLCFQKSQWHERAVGIDAEERLILGLLPAPETLVHLVPSAFRQGQEGVIYEVSPARDRFVEETSRMIARCGGAALWIDYGHGYSGAGDTLQAVRSHRFVPWLESPGEVDITSHVDFQRLRDLAVSSGMQNFFGLWELKRVQRL